MKKFYYLGAVCALAIATAPAQADWLHFSDSVFHADGAKKKHPKTLERTLVLPTEATGAVRVCFKYGNNHAKKGKGKVAVDVEISRAADEESQFVEFEEAIKDNVAEACQKVRELAAGDIVVFSFAFKNMPRVGAGNLAKAAVAVGVDGENPIE